MNEDLWIRDGKILNPEKLFFEEHGHADIVVDCNEAIIAPGYIDIQINGECSSQADLQMAAQFSEVAV